MALIPQVTNSKYTLNEYYKLGSMALISPSRKKENDRGIDDKLLADRIFTPNDSPPYTYEVHSRLCPSHRYMVNESPTGQMSF